MPGCQTNMYILTRYALFYMMNIIFDKPLKHQLSCDLLSDLNLSLCCNSHIGRTILGQGLCICYELQYRTTLIAF